MAAFLASIVIRHADTAGSLPAFVCVMNSKRPLIKTFALAASLLALAVPARAQSWVPMPVPTGTVVPANPAVDSEGNSYNIVNGSGQVIALVKTTPGGISTTVATAQITQVVPLHTYFYTYSFSGLAFDGLGNVYAAESPPVLAQNAPELILKVTPAGVTTLTTVVSGGLIFGKRPNDCSIAADLQGNVYTVGVDGSIYMIKPDGTQITVAADLEWFFDGIGNFPNYPQGLSIDAQGDVFTYATRLNPSGYAGPVEFVRLTPSPLITYQPRGATIPFGSSLPLSVTAASTAVLTYQWQLNGANLPGAAAAGYAARAAGTYTVVVTTSAGSVTSNPAVVTLANRLINLSSRAAVGTGSGIGIAGFVISSDSGASKQTLIRAVGPSLAQFGLSNILAQPVLSVFNADGQPIASNTGWNNSPAIAAAAVAAGAFALAPGSADSALLLDLAPGAYTAQVSGDNSAAGVALVEVYETAPDSGHFVNISTRAPVGTGANILIGGLIVGGSQPSQVLIRAVGPGLASFGISGVLAQPVLSIYNAAGQLVAVNIGWSNGGSADAVALAAAATKTGAFPLQPGSEDSALLLTLAPGAYTAQVSGANDSTGIALVESYQVPQ